MTKNAKVFVFILVALIVIAGILFLNLKQRENFPAIIKNKEIISSHYLISTPSYGPLIRLQNILVSFEGDKAIGVLSNQDASEASTPQKVVLYDKSGFTQPLGGKVIAVEAEEDTKKIIIQLPEKTNTDLLLNELDIITLETISSKRLPKSAIMKDDAGKDYIWIATPTEDKSGFSIQQLNIDVGLNDLDFFEEGGFKIRSDNLVILNPDDKLNADNIYALQEVQMNAPLHNPIKQAWIDFEISRLNQQQKEMQEIADNCGKTDVVAGDTNTAPSGTSSSSASDSCGANFEGGATDPFAIFNSLINKQE